MMIPTSEKMTCVVVPGFPEVHPGTDLAELTVRLAAAAGDPVATGDILVLAQKIVSKAENRVVALADVDPSEKAIALAAATDKDPRIVELILAESQEIVRARPGLIIARHRSGLVLANAGIDLSNAGRDGSAVLLPRDADLSAAAIREAILTLAGCAVGVIVNDSLGRAWRVGTTGTAIGASGVDALADRRGRSDRSGMTLRVSEIGLADEIAAAASLLMGQGSEGHPAVLVRGLAWALGDGSAADLVRPRELDLFA